VLQPSPSAWLISCPVDSGVGKALAPGRVATISTLHFYTSTKAANAVDPSTAHANIQPSTAFAPVSSHPLHSHGDPRAHAREY